MSELNTHSNLDQLVAALLTFLEPFNEYDREERCQALFGEVDPNDQKAFRDLIDREFFLNSWYGKTPIHIKRSLAASLIEALQNDSFDFKWLVEEADGTFGLPSAWYVNDHRCMFEEIYRALYCHWRTELEESGFSLPSLRELNIPRE